MKDDCIVITGIGIIAPQAIGKVPFWNALKEGKTGVNRIAHFDTSNFKSKHAGFNPDFKPEEILGSKGLRELDRTTRLLCSASKLAIEDSKVTITPENTDECGVITATTLSSLWNIAEFDRGVIQDGPLFSDVSLFPGTVVNAASSQVSIRHNIQGFNTTVSTGYTASIDALQYAIDFLRLDRVKTVILGATESVSLAHFIGFYNLGFLAGITGPEISCPFDSRSNGIILGEGACVFILEKASDAKARNATIYATIDGIGSYFEAYKLGKYHPQAEGIRFAMKQALKNSHKSAKEISYISASANSVSDQDTLETQAIKDIFGSHSKTVSVTALKSLTGEMFSSSGLFQIAAAAGSFSDNFIPAIANLKTVNKDCDLNLVQEVQMNTPVDSVMVNCFGPGGNCASVIVSKPA